MSAECAFLALLFAFLLLALFSSQHWHSLAEKQESVSFSLREFGLFAEEGKNACFTLAVSPENLEEARELSVEARLNGTEVLRDSLEVFRGELEKEYCFKAGMMQEENLVEVFAGEERLFYHLKKGSIQATEPQIAIEKVENSTVNLYITNFSRHKYAPLEIFVNGKLDHRLYPSEQEQRFAEKISPVPGKNLVRAEFLGAKAEKESFQETAFALNPAAGILLLLLGLLVFLCFVFPGREFIERAALSISCVFALFIADSLLLDFMGMLNAGALAAFYLADLIIIALVLRKKFSLSKLKFKAKEIPFIYAIAVFLLVFTSLALHLFTPSYFTYFNVYYERQSNFIASQGAIPATDEMSYLGRNFSFVPGYFLIEGSIALLTGTGGTELFALSLALSNIFLFFSALYFARSLKLSKEHSALFFVLLSTSTFIFSALSVTPRHAIALSFLFVSAALFLRYKKWFHSAGALALTAFVQIPTLLWFAFLVPAAQKKVRWKPLLKTLLAAFFLFALIYSPTLLSSGIPAQSRPTDWGYLIRLPLGYVLSDLGILFVLFAAFTAAEAVSLLQGKLRANALQKKLFIAAIASILIQLFVSSRWNIVSSVTIALFLSHALAERSRHSLKEFYSALGAVILLGLYIAFLSFPSYTLSAQITAPMEFLHENSSSAEPVLADPFYGHALAFVSQRGTLADLCVEYADEKKLADSYEFLKTGNTAILERYALHTVFSHRRIINEHVVDNPQQEKDIEFPELEKVFANEQFFVHRKIS